MMNSVVVAWGPGTPFVQLVLRFIAPYTRRRGDEPGAALGYVWQRLRKRFHVGQVIDPEDRLLKTIVRRKVSSYYARLERPPGYRVGQVSLAEVMEPSQARDMDPTERIARRETQAALEAAIDSLSPYRRKAVRTKFKLGDFQAAGVRPEGRGSTPQNIHKLARKGFEELQRSKDLKRFA